MSLSVEMQRSLGQEHSCQESLGADSLCVYLDRSEQLLPEILDHLGQHVFWHCPVESIWSSLHPLGQTLRIAGITLVIKKDLLISLFTLIDSVTNIP